MYLQLSSSLWRFNVAGNKSLRGNAAQFFVAGELSRRGLVAAITLGNTPNTDILCSNIEGTKFVHIQVKAYIPGNRTCTLGSKEIAHRGGLFFWVLVGISPNESQAEIDYYIIPSEDMASNVNNQYETWLREDVRRKSKVRTLTFPHKIKAGGWDISAYKNNWRLIKGVLNDEPERQESPRL